jgi:hypothetical protein
MKASGIIRDGLARPELFHWNGRMNVASLQRWLEEHDLLDRCPADLLSLWEETGGGDVLESETILGPMGDPAVGDDIVATNIDMRSRGMPDRFFVFHTGLLTSAVDTTLGDYVELLLPGFHVVRRFSSLDEWYRRTLREEYASRYGLPNT